MIIYNTLECPVVLTLEDKTYRIEEESELEVKISSGDHYFSAYKLHPDTGEPMRKYKSDYYPGEYTEVYRGKVVRSNGVRYDRHRNVTAICLGASGTLTMNRATKLYIRDMLADHTILRIPSERYCADVLDFLVEEGEISHRKDGCVDDLTRQKIMRSFWIQLISSLVGGFLVIALSAVMWGIMAMRGGMTTDLLLLMTTHPDMMLYTIGPIAAIVWIVINLFNIRKRHQLKDLPMLPTKEEYDAEYCY